MTRRNAVRRPRRLSVRFWKRGETASFVGHTTNISTTGMFLATNSPAPSGARVRIEVVERDRGFVVEGVVAHARKVRPELAKISESGMGIRFLTIGELVSELLPGSGGLHDDSQDAFSPYAPGAAPIPQAPNAPPGPPPSGASPFPEPAATPFPPPATPFPPPLRRVEISDFPVAPTAPEAAPAPGPSGGPGAPPVGGIGTFAVRFGSPAEFLEIYRRDILNGGLFVSTRFPARLQETVVVQLHPPLDNVEPVSMRARVVQRFEPQAGDLTPNLLSGMGLELIDLPAIVEKMLPVIARLVGG
jgi:hypothetical protein